MAVGTSGQVAKVMAVKGNRMKLTRGVVEFQEVEVQAEGPGEYVIRVVSGSKRLPLQDATVTLKVPRNETSALADVF